MQQARLQFLPVHCHNERNAILLSRGGAMIE